MERRVTFMHLEWLPIDRIFKLNIGFVNPRFTAYAADSKIISGENNLISFCNNFV